MREGNGKEKKKKTQNSAKRRAHKPLVFVREIVRIHDKSAGAGLRESQSHHQGLMAELAHTPQYEGFLSDALSARTVCVCVRNKERIDHSRCVCASG